jgi:hypothetical protein
VFSRNFEAGTSEMTAKASTPIGFRNCYAGLACQNATAARLCRRCRYRADQALWSSLAAFLASCPARRGKGDSRENLAAIIGTS